MMLHCPDCAGEPTGYHERESVREVEVLVEQTEKAATILDGAADGLDAARYFVDGERREELRTAADEVSQAWAHARRALTILRALDGTP